MSYYKNWLQFFADGGAPAGEGGGADTGVDAGTPGPQLEDLGVPADKAERFRQRKQKAAPAPKAAKDDTSSAADAAPSPQGEGSKATSWDEFFKDPQNNQRLQQMMSERVNRVGRQQSEYISKLSPALELIASRYGIEADENGGYDAEAIAKAITEDDSYYEQKALEMGVDTETAKRIEKLETENRRNEEALQRQQRDQQLREHFMKLQQQAEDVKSIMPGFNLQEAINDPKFMWLTAPDNPQRLTVKEAIWALHGDEIQAQAVNAVAQRAKLDAANAIRSGIRPRENGSSTAAVSTSPNMRNMTREERRAYIMQKYAPPD